MTIKLLTIGKTDDPALQNLIDTYVNRLGHYNRFELEVIPDLKKTKNLSVEQQKCCGRQTDPGEIKYFRFCGAAR